MKKILCALLILVLLFLGVACGSEEVPDPTDSGVTELRVLTEDISGYCYREQLEYIQEQFEGVNGDVTVRLEFLPTEEEERAVYLDQLRTEIMAGGGPDVYLMPTGLGWENDMLFPDENQAMRSMLFADISAYYDADDALNTQALHPDVMDAGTLDGGRYILPLRYSMPVIFADTASLEANHTDIESISNIDGLLDFVVSSGDPAWASVVFPTIACNTAYDPTNPNPYTAVGLDYFAPYLDYENNEVLLSREELISFMKQYRALFQLYGIEEQNLARSFLSYTLGYPVLGERAPVKLGTLSDIPMMMAIANAEGRALTVAPLQAVSGGSIANITFYGAVGAGCRDTELAYSFLRLFLTEEAQWELYESPDPAANWDLPGFPVRTEDCVEPYWQYVNSAKKNLPARTKWVRDVAKLSSQTFTDEDIPIIAAEIQHVCYQIPTEWDTAGNIFISLQVLAEGQSEYSNEDYARMADQILDELVWHLAEG